MRELGGGRVISYISGASPHGPQASEHDHRQFTVQEKPSCRRKLESVELQHGHSREVCRRPATEALLCGRCGSRAGYVPASRCRSPAHTALAASECQDANRLSPQSTSRGSSTSVGCPGVSSLVSLLNKETRRLGAVGFRRGSTTPRIRLRRPHRLLSRQAVSVWAGGCSGLWGAGAVEREAARTVEGFFYAGVKLGCRLSFPAGGWKV